jgi:hypothetical protein
VEAALHPAGWAPQAEALQALPGAHFDVLQQASSDGQVVDKPFKAPPGAAAAASGVSSGGAAGGGGAAGAASAAGGEGEAVLVMFLGGCTFSEVSALRWLSSRPECPHTFLVGTTKMVNGKTLVQTFLDPAAPLAKSSGFRL